MDAFVNVLNVSRLNDLLLILQCILFVSSSSLLHSDRDPIPDVPAIYFIMPTEENIDRICQVNLTIIVSITVCSINKCQPSC